MRSIKTRRFLIIFMIAFVLTTTISIAAATDCISSCLIDNNNGPTDKNESQLGSNAAYRKCLASCQIFVTDQCDQPINSSGAVCSPRLLDIKETPNRHMVIPWYPCSSGLYAVKGYNVTITGDDLFECYKLSLNFKLTDTETRFAMISNAGLKYSSKYTVLVESLPYNANQKWRAKPIEYTSKDCTEWHSIGSCECAIEEVKKTYRSNFVLDNFSYRVSASFQRLPPCYNMVRIVVRLLLVATDNSDGNNGTTIESKIDDNTFEVGTMENGSVTFEQVFPPRFGYRTIVQVHGIYADGTESQMYKMPLATSAPLPIRAYAPMTPWLCKTDNETTNPVNNVYYLCYEAYHGYPAYVLQVRQCNGDVCRTLKTLNLNQATVQSNVTSDGKSSISYYLNMDGVQNGVYLIRVREDRPTTSFTPLFDPAPWSYEHKINHFLYKEPYVPSTSVVVATVAVFLLSAVAVVALCFYFCRKDFCRTYMSGEMHEKLKMFVTSQQAELQQQKKLWLVWLTDHRSPQLKDSHLQVIRDLAAYLRVVCGIDVVLDLYEEERVVEGVSSWMQSSHDRSQFVVLVCPHYAYTHHRHQQHGSFFGDFDKSFKYLEPFLANKVKYITVNLPYSDPDCCDGAKWLHKTTTKYSLMDQIEDFYFHVQGCSNFDLTGKHSAEFIDHKNFAKTTEGALLQQSIAAFQSAQEKYKRGEKSVVGDCDVIDDPDRATTYIEIPEENRRELEVSLLTIKKPEGFSVEKEERYPVFDDYDDEVVRPPPLLSLVEDDEDPEEKLRLLNAL